jgi:glutathione S-transferase
MILIGQFDSPFVRRVGIALELYGLAYDHKPWSTFGDADKIRPYNPTLRVPTLVLDDGESLIESHAILDHLDSRVPPERRLFPGVEPARRRALMIAALATGMADKAVGLFYEKRLHDAVSPRVVERWSKQVHGGLGALETEAASRRAKFWFGDAPGHADIAVACCWRFAVEAHPGLIAAGAYPALEAHAAACEALAAFKKIVQPFIPPA